MITFLKPYITKKTSGAIPTKIVKLGNQQIRKDLWNCINERKNKFQTELNVIDLMPLSKKRIH